MDILLKIREKVDPFKKSNYYNGLNSVLVHIDRAEKYFECGTNKADEQYFNDVIYRSNQAFEGILKEAYKILAEQDINKLRPFDIENYFVDNDIFNERVKKLFSNYRTEWRNTSTHNYNLFFSEDEAFLALNSVASFIYVLLNQISEKISYIEETQLLEQINQEVVVDSMIECKTSFSDFLSDNLLKIPCISQHSIINCNTNLVMTESQFMGRLAAFIDSLNPDITIKREGLVISGHNKKFRPDFILEYNNEKVIMETKKYFTKERESASIEQLVTYLQAANVDTGILFMFNNMSKSKKETITIEMDGRVYKIIKITPSVEVV